MANLLVLCRIMTNGILYTERSMSESKTKGASIGMISRDKMWRGYLPAG